MILLVLFQYYFSYSLGFIDRFVYHTLSIIIIIIIVIIIIIMEILFYSSEDDFFGTF